MRREGRRKYQRLRNGLDVNPNPVHLKAEYVLASAHMGLSKAYQLLHWYRIDYWEYDMTISLLLSQGKRHTKQCQSAGADFVGAEATDSKDLYECLWVSPLDTVHVWAKGHVSDLLPLPLALHIKSSSGGIQNGVVCHWSTPMAWNSAHCAHCSMLQTNCPPTWKNFRQTKTFKNFRKLLNTCRAFGNFEKLRIQTLRNLPNSVQNLQIPSELKLFQVPWKTFPLLLKPSDPRTFQLQNLPICLDLLWTCLPPIPEPILQVWAGPIKK